MPTWMPPELWDALARVDAPFILLIVAIGGALLGIVIAPLYSVPARVAGMRAYLILSVKEISAGLGQVTQTGGAFGIGHLAYLLLELVFAVAFGVGIWSRQRWERARYDQQRNRARAR